MLFAICKYKTCAINVEGRAFNEKYKTIIGENKFKYMHAANSAGALYHKENFSSR